MSDVHSRLSARGRVVVPKIVRQKLGLKSGDLIRFRVGEKGAVTIDKVRASEDDPFMSFGEWNSEEDKKLYGRL